MPNVKWDDDRLEIEIEAIKNELQAIRDLPQRMGVFEVALAKLNDRLDLVLPMIEEIRDEARQERKEASEERKRRRGARTSYVVAAIGGFAIVIAALIALLFGS
jgi:hypothetical protein